MCNVELVLRVRERYTCLATGPNKPQLYCQVRTFNRARYSDGAPNPQTNLGNRRHRFIKHYCGKLNPWRT
ncbi:MAG: hypothetical protein QOJ65_1224 [Fimbriimonadaceae bacterium]|nr:hypothetical protein [Fimbriimonadaceae bacterium]